MQDQDDTPGAATKPPEQEDRKTSLLRTVISLSAFIAVDYWLFKSWLAVAILVSVIVIHESGHFIAMKLFGYKAVNMTFVPFVGAYVSGQAINLSRKNKLIVLLAGPVPGIIIGSVLFCLYKNNLGFIYWQAAMPFLLLNGFNLLPVFPLDGGQFFQALFFSGSKIIQLVFLYLSIVVMIFLFFKLHFSWVFLLLPVLVFLRTGNVLLINRARKKLDEQGLNYASSYEDLTDEEYYHIRAALINSSNTLAKRYSTEEQTGDEQSIIKLVESVLVQPYTEDLSPAGKAIFTIIWIAAFITPLLTWFAYKGEY